MLHIIDVLVQRPRIPSFSRLEQSTPKERNVFLYIRFNYNDIGSALDAPISEFG